MVEATASVIGVRWDFYAECRDAPPDLFVPDIDVFKLGDTENLQNFDLDHPSSEHLKYCNVCPVKTECLDYALEHSDVIGIWGGTSSYERGQMRRPRHRPHCPSCGSDRILQEGRNEICTSCAISWNV